MSLQPSNSPVNQVSGAVLGVVLKQRPDDEFDIDFAIAKTSGLIPDGKYINTNSLRGREIELAFNPKPLGHAEATASSPRGTTIYNVNSLKVISQAASH